jgi:hypothetical protein
MSVDALDGEVGRVEEFFFDDDQWTVRYILLKTGWLNPTRKVVSPIAVSYIDWNHDRVSVNLNQEQVKNCPSFDTDAPISRQKEMEFYDYYRWPYYWTDAGVWGIAPSPVLMLTKPYLTQSSPTDSAEIHLKSTRSVVGYHIEALDGHFGHVEDFLFDEETWTIRYLVIDTRNWLPGKRVLVAPEWVDAISWENEKLFLHLPSEKVKQSPEYNPEKTVDREYEDRLHNYYGHSKYWTQEEIEKEVSRRKVSGG